MQVSEIKKFLEKCSRDENDATNKIRERILKNIQAIPEDFLNDSTYGESWKLLLSKWNEAIIEVSKIANIPEHTRYVVRMKGGRRTNYDADIDYFNGNTKLQTVKLEFKYGCESLNGLPQFLSLQVKFGLFPVTYDRFFYDNYLDKYIAVDSGITLQKPSWEVYKKQVTNVKASISPFFAMLKERESIEKEKKFCIVNESIREYLKQHAASIDTASLIKKFIDSQKGKVFALWSDGKFHIDKISETEMSDLVFKGVFNDNRIDLVKEKTTYGLLLRWRNHKGIQNPAWQISMKREA